MQEWMNRPVIYSGKAVSEMRKRYTVVACAENTYPEIKAELEKNDLIEFTDFEYYETYRKKVAIIYGNCHTRVIKAMLKSNEEFDRQYGFYPILQIQRIDKLNKGMMQSHAFEKCDLFLHGCIRKDNKYGEEFCSEMYIERLPKECKVVGFPNMYGLPTFLYPQVDYNTEYKLGGGILSYL